MSSCGDSCGDGRPREPALSEAEGSSRAQFGSERGPPQLGESDLGLPHFLLDSLPSPLYMPRLRVGLPDADSKRELPIELGMRKVEIATAIQPVHQELIGLVSRAQPEASQIKLSGRGQFEARIAAHPVRKLLGQPYVLANVVLQALNPVMPDHKPELQRAETPPQ